jgi:hypothetical protein
MLQTEWKNVDFGKAKSIREFAVHSAICELMAEIPVDSDKVKVRGFAVSGGGREIIRVDVLISLSMEEAQLLTEPRTYKMFLEEIGHGRYGQ